MVGTLGRYILSVNVFELYTGIRLMKHSGELQVGTQKKRHLSHVRFFGPAA